MSGSPPQLSFQIMASPPPRAIPHHWRGQSVQRVRWVVERAIPCLLRAKRLVLRYDRTQPTLRPLLTLAGVLINLRRLVQIEY